MGAFAVFVGDGCCIAGSPLRMVEPEDSGFLGRERRQCKTMTSCIPFAVRVGGGRQGWKDLHAALACTGQGMLLVY